MKPVFQIIAGRQDVTAHIQDRLVSLQVTDEDGYSADTLTISIDNRDGVVVLPETNVVLDVSLGYRETALTYIGQFAVDKVAGSGFPLMMTIEATAANMTTALRAPKTRAWQDISLTELVSEIAGGAGLAAAVGKSLADIKWPYIAQTAESDLNLLTRLARSLDATAKPAGGALVVVKRGEDVNAAGDPITPLAVRKSDLSSFNWSTAEREKYASVEAEWGDIDAAKTEKVTAGSGTPTRKLRHVFHTAEEARRAAESELTIAGRAGFNLGGTFHLFQPFLFAGGKITTSDIQTGVDGSWLVRKVTHTLNTSLTTEFAAERAV